MQPTPAGELRHRVTLQRATTSNDLGQTKLDWTDSDVGTYWAKVICKSGSEDAKVEGTRPMRSYEITMRYVGPIYETDRFIWQGKTLNVESVIDKEGERVEYLITAKQEV